LGLLLAFIVVALVGAGCASSKPVSPTAAPTQPATVTAAAPTATAASAAVKLADLPTGVDADGNFYRGDPNAPVRLVEFSDFQ
jgi:protein-disulfide isomerase